mmetsp:Transcript_1257/g.2271  ORF Transcript_1257/g.2271 Transcript_1257/m.2271 type:complete len:102 (-) Transcript_1257:356-661(-)
MPATTSPPSCVGQATSVTFRQRNCLNQNPIRGERLLVLTRTRNSTQTKSSRSVIVVNMMLNFSMLKYRANIQVQCSSLEEECIGELYGGAFAEDHGWVRTS